MLLKNYEYLKNSMIGLHNVLKKNIYNPESSIIKYDDKGIYYVKDEKAVYLHSTVDTKYEVEAILDNYPDIETKDEIILFGIGDGEIIKQITEKVPESTKIYVIDFMNIIQHLLHHADYSAMQLNRVKTVTILGKDMNATSFLNQFIFDTKGSFEIIVLPQYQRLFPKEIQMFIDKLAAAIMSKRKAANVNSAYEKRWISNSVKNFPHLLETTNIMSLKNYNFEESVVLIIAAGPSLDYDLELLRTLSEKNNVYMFAVGSANRTLLKNGINPDAILTYDPSTINHTVLSEYLESDVQTPIIFGSSVGSETLIPFDERFKYHMLINQDTLSSNLIKDAFESDKINDMPTIALITLQLVVKLGFKKVVFCGQNLGYHDNKRYASGMEAKKTEVTARHLKSSIVVKDVYGNDMITEESFNGMRLLLEQLVSSVPTVEFINTTKYGAALEGTKFIPLEEIADSFSSCKKPFDLRSDVIEDHYDVKKIILKYRNMTDSWNDCRSCFVSIDSLLKEIGDALDNNKVNHLKDLDIKLEKEYNKLLKNQYFLTILKPMNRNQFNFMLADFNKIKFEKDIKEKFNLLYTKIGSFMLNVINDYNSLNNDFIAIGKKIEEKNKEL